jgi:hypothetical protein
VRQASSGCRTVGGRATPVARSARLAAGREAERTTKRLPCSNSVSVRESRSATMSARSPRGRARRCGRQAPSPARGRGSYRTRDREWSRRACGRSAASRTGAWPFGRSALRSNDPALGTDHPRPEGVSGWDGADAGPKRVSVHPHIHGILVSISRQLSVSPLPAQRQGGAQRSLREVLAK